MSTKASKSKPSYTPQDQVPLPPPDADVIAFNTICTHLGGPLAGGFKPDDQALGPCPLHQTTYDLTRHGMIIAGHATESLPQVLMELDGDDIYAVGMLGLIYGRHDNLKA